MKLILVAALVALAQARPEDSKLDKRLLSSIKQEQTADIMVTFWEGTGDVLQSVDNTWYATRGEKNMAIRTELMAHAQRVQSGIIGLVQGRFVYKSFWITNQVYIKGATLDLVIQLMNRDEVRSISEEEIIQLDTVVSGPVTFGRRQDQEEWGIVKIQAKAARDQLNNASATAFPVVVSTIDTGARYTHEALRDNWMGPDYGWFDPYDGNLLPMDLNGHGTHTTGTICGKGGIGVFPDAKWTSCRGCATASCSQPALLSCAQFIVCPTNPSGANPDCSKAPQLVSNSWGGGRGATWYDPAIEAFHAAGIIPLFSIGNSGPSCNTANSPGDRNVVGVGSTTIQDALSSFSSVGPTIDGRMKPDISAPGSDVISAYNTADNAYRSLSGTSMACPHSAGLTSLLLAYNPGLRFSQVMALIKDGADRGLVSSGRVCEGIPDTRFPNYNFGDGRINALTSVKMLIESSK